MQCNQKCLQALYNGIHTYGTRKHITVPIQHKNEAADAQIAPHNKWLLVDHTDDHGWLLLLPLPMLPLLLLLLPLSLAMLLLLSLALISAACTKLPNKLGATLRNN